MEDELDYKLYNKDIRVGIYPFSEEFILDLDWYERKRKQEITNRNVEELQMRLNLQIEAEKERLWSDDKTPTKLDLENILGWLGIPEPFKDNRYPYHIRKIMYDLFYDSPGYVVFDPHAIYFK